MKLTKTDHHEQALVADQNEFDVIKKAMSLMLSAEGISPQKLFIAKNIFDFLESKNKEDQPALFLRSHGNIINCPDCGGSRFEKHCNDDDRNIEPEYLNCNTCKGEGQLYLEIIRKGYVPTYYHRKKLAK